MPACKSNNTETAENSIEEMLIQIDKDGVLGRNECVKIYRFWGLGRRIVNALPRYAMSIERKISNENAPDEATKRFLLVSKKMRQDNIVKQCSLYTRIFGISGLYVLPSAGNSLIKPIDPLTIKDIQKGIVFNVLDPLNITQIQFEQNPLSPKYMRPRNMIIQGQRINTNRGLITTNGVPIYINFIPSTFKFSGVSVFQNMLPLIHTWARAVISLRRICAKAAAIVFKGGNDGRFNNGVTVSASQDALQQLQNMTANGATSISQNSEVSFFNLTGVQEVDAILKSIENEILLALDDTPKSLLLDERISSGMAEGSKDYNIAILAINEFRDNILSPIYEFTDKYIMQSAWDDNFIHSLSLNQKEYENMTVEQIRQYWIQGFSYEYGNLTPEPETEKMEVKARKLENIINAKNLGASNDFMELEINGADIFQQKIDLTNLPTTQNDTINKIFQGLKQNGK